MTREATTSVSEVPSVREVSRVCGQLADGIGELRAVAEMVGAVATLCELAAGTDHIEPDHAALWSGVAVVMDRVSRDCGALRAEANVLQRQLLDAHVAGAATLADGAR